MNRLTINRLTMKKMEEKRMSDLISREEVVKGIKLSCLGKSDVIQAESAILRYIDKIPSAELIRCKDCKWWDKGDDTPYGYCFAMKHGYFSSNWEIGIYRKYKGDFYCADAEKKEKDE